MIFFDTETTGLLLPGVDDADKQPRIIELAAVSLDDSGEERASFSTLVNPGVLLPEEITKITGLTDADLLRAPTFPEVLSALIEFFRADPHHEVVAHNVEFDQWMLIYELRRCGWEHRFPYPMRWTDTVPLSGGKKLANWGKEVLGDKMAPQSHRALDDVRLLIECWRTLK